MIYMYMYIHTIIDSISYLLPCIRPQDLRSSKTLVSEMHRVVDLNVSQVVDFELRQAHSTL